MTVLEIVKFPNPILKKKSKVVVVVDDNLRRMMDDMMETMYKTNGIGLAAVQVGVLLNVLVMNISYKKDDGIILGGEDIFMINPEIIYKSKDKSCYNEGCLSFPEIQVEVKRAKRVRVRFLNYFGKEQILDCDELLSTCVQHEMDHLNGITFVDYLSKLKRGILLKRYRKKYIKNENI
jgi:peptide deformylase